MKIKLFYHSTDFFDTTITKDQAELLETSGLLDAVDEAFIMVHYNVDNYKWLFDRWKDRKNVRFIHFGDDFREWHEATTIQYIQEYVNGNEDCYVVYMHTKGNYNRSYHNGLWRKHLEYWNIKNWRDCVEMLDEGYDTVGAAWHPENPKQPFFAGNFWWARSSYLRKCKQLKTPPDANFEAQFEGQPHHRFDNECWAGSGDPKWFEFHEGPIRRWYMTPEMYQK